MSAPQISTLAFLTPGNYLDDDPYTGLEDTLRLFEFGERLGFDGAWVRQRHLEHGVGSAAVFLAAAAQRTSRVELGTSELRLELPYEFHRADYEQILHDAVELIAPELGWKPAFG
ncbi:LLM class flavin-dependent oxidoreductase [Nocardia sp. NPDC058497]|uniref:LLM class flavin-dependent oxidoreductase n=1 Tax=Nocardia sp. NPDC058497 TaxID=3346529 RepID=UPI0036484233